MRNIIKKIITDYVAPTAAGVLMAIIVFGHFVTHGIVAGESMYPTYKPHDYVVAVAYAPIQRGDVVAARFVDQTIIKRVVAVEGETVVIDGEQQTIPAGHIYVIGDNCNNSFDSREFGPLPIADAKKVIMHIACS